MIQFWPLPIASSEIRVGESQPFDVRLALGSLEVVPLAMCRLVLLEHE